VSLDGGSLWTQGGTLHHLPKILSDEGIACGNKAYLYGACCSYLGSGILLNLRPNSIASRR
jgi:hypothetical protein